MHVICAFLLSGGTGCEPKWNEDGRKGGGRDVNPAQKQRQFSLMHPTTQGSTGTNRPLISSLLAFVCVSTSETTFINPTTYTTRENRICTIGI